MASSATVTEISTFTPTAAQRQVFTLACFSGRASVPNYPLQEQLNALEAEIGAWNVVWGPCNTFPLFSLESNPPADNTMYVAQAANTAQPTFVVAIAGTNPASVFDWLLEDLDIDSREWPYASAGQVTTGDNSGLSNLLNMKSGGQTLQEFLFSIPDKANASLTFTGQSLGGALSPMLTLALMDPASTLNRQNDVSIGNWGEVSLLALAGPSIGDSSFVQYFETTLAAASCAFIWNANDIVPHAWNAATMMELTSPSNIYGLALDPTQCLAKQLARRQNAAAAHDYTQFEATPAFAGQLQPYTTTVSQGQWTPESEFLAQALYQHTIAYLDAFDCPTLPPPNVPDLCGDPQTAAKLLAIVNKLCL